MVLLHVVLHDYWSNRSTSFIFDKIRKKKVVVAFLLSTYG